MSTVRLAQALSLGALLLSASSARAASVSGLSSVDLRLQIAEDLTSYTLAGSWIVRNPGSVRSVPLEVPLPSADAVVDVRLGPMAMPCAPTGDRCVVDVPLAAIGEAQVTWTVKGKLAHVDAHEPGRALPTYGERTLSFDALPSGLDHRVGRLRVRLDAGAAKGFAKLAGLRGDGPTWTLREVDPASVGRLQLRVDAAPVLTHRTLAAWNRGVPDRPNHVVTSSTHIDPEDPRAYDAPRLADGDPATAWCEGVPGDGTDEWIEISTREGVGACRLEGVAIVPGFARDAARWEAFGRLTQVRIARCGSGGASIDADLAGAPRWNASAVLVPAGPLADEATTEGPLCLTVTVLAAKPGARMDQTCVAEIAPVLACP